MFQAFNARALRSGPRDLTVRLPFTARAILPFTAPHRAPIPPGLRGASPHAATCPVTKPEPEVFGRRYPSGYAFEPPRYAGATRVFVDIAASRRAGRTRRRVLPAFSTRDLRRHRARRPEPRGLPGHHLTPTPIRLKVHSRAPRLKKKIGEPPTDLHPSPRSTHRS